MSIQACAELVERGDPDRFLATMASPVAAREKLFPIYAFNLEVARAPWVASEPMIAEMRLQWWRDALEEIGQGAVVRRHEVVSPLAEVLAQPDTDLLDKLVQARRWDVYRDPFEDAAHFDEYIDATSGNLMWVTARALGADSGEDVVRDFGYGVGVAQWLRAIPELEARGRIPLLDGRAEGVAALAKTALARLRNARAKRGAVPSAAHGAMLVGWQAEPILKAAMKTPEAVAAGQLAQSEFARRSGLLLRSFSGRW
ncbi:squalene/phytoene synthase family protein [Actibacterium lipolyticum]|uniref:Squalene/phytoene synthase n=1 Tax=Actibacterium lipolyticum TaxID=1524263 RepID=A0A238KFM3_9RHOB|nr:squalene/phytoene synthase family protein [Actibacterium lipolyticum]SMX41659.1 Squalene/phytoene synthase [Actibacterium lipolyticum]